MASTPVLLISLILSFLSLLSLSAALPSHTVVNAAEILSDSGFNSMSLTLELVSGSLAPSSPSLTVFAPPDSEFRRLGQPSLSLLQYHFSPLALPLDILRSLPLGTNIPTLLSGQSLVVTAPPSDGDISLNDVKIATASPVYDDGFLIILAVERFFDPNFLVPAPDRVPFPDLVCGTSDSETVVGFPGASWLNNAAADLRSQGYEAMASFLEQQLLGFKNQSSLTVFAPLDQAIESSRPPLQDTSVLLRHVVPCRLDWSDLVNFNEGAVLQTYMEGFNITISRSGDVLLFNGAPVYHANVHYGDSLVVHGLMETLGMPAAAAAAEAQEEGAVQSSSEEDQDEEAGDDGNSESILVDKTEF